MQFYLLYPIFLALVWKFFNKSSYRFIAVIALFLASFIGCLLVSNWKSTIAFYLLPTRTWEFVGGGVVFLINRHVSLAPSISKNLNLLGFLIFFAALFLINKNTLWPSGWTLLPIFSAMLIIFAAHQDSKFTNNLVCQWLGNISYSVYLWHWPIAVLLHYLELQNDGLAILMGVMASLILGHASYAWIETPLRAGLEKKIKLQQVAALFIPVFLASSFMQYSKTYTFEGRVNPVIDKLARSSENFRANREACQPNINGLKSPGCVFGQKDGELLAYLVGDSHSDMVASAVGEAAAKHGGYVKFYGRMGCPTIKGVLIDSSSRAACLNFNNWLFEFLENDRTDVPVIIVNSIWMTDKDGRVEFLDLDSGSSIQEIFRDKALASLCELSKKRVVYVALPMPSAGVKGPETLSKQLLLEQIKAEDLEQIRTFYQEELKRSRYMRYLYSLASEQCEALVLDPLPYFCDETTCEIMKDGEHYFYDGSHLNEFGNKRLVPMFERVFIMGEM